MEASNPRLTTSGSNPALSPAPSVTQTVPLDRSQPKLKAPVKATEPETVAAATTEPVPTRGLSRAFDSTEATQRLLAQTLDPQNAPSPQQDPESTAPMPPPSLRRMRAAHPWGERENKILAATVMVALALAAWIITA
jgi:hypothetical protein